MRFAISYCLFSDVINFEINRSFLIKAFICTNKKPRQKCKYLKKYKLTWNKKHFSSFLKGSQLSEIFSDLWMSPEEKCTLMKLYGKLHGNLFSNIWSLRYMQYNIWLLSHICLSLYLCLIASLSFSILFLKIIWLFFILLFITSCCAKLKTDHINRIVAMKVNL